jgi:hypothetical protein
MSPGPDRSNARSCCCRTRARARVELSQLASQLLPLLLQVDSRFVPVSFWTPCGRQHTLRTLMAAEIHPLPSGYGMLILQASFWQLTKSRRCPRLRMRIARSYMSCRVYGTGHLISHIVGDGKPAQDRSGRYNDGHKPHFAIRSAWTDRIFLLL